MPKSRRDNFKESIKRSLAFRAGHKCSFPNCGIVTSGPSNVSLVASVKIGVAAHICSAAPGGPRYDNQMSPEERSCISNAIWLCPTHSTLIDRDPIKYTKEILLKMKNEHESRIGAEISRQGTVKIDNDLIALGPDMIFSGELISIKENAWCIKIDNFLLGDLHVLIKYCENFDDINTYNRYVLLNTLGDGRQLACKPSWKKNDSNYIISFQILKSFPRTNVHNLPQDFATNEKNDIFLVNGNLAIISGLDSLPQRLKLYLFTQRGEYPFDTNFGSWLKGYFDLFRDSPWLSRLIKLEVIRHACIPYPASKNHQTNTPFYSVLRVHSVEQLLVQNATISDWIKFRFILEVEGLTELWQEDIPLFIPLRKDVNTKKVCPT